MFPVAPGSALVRRTCSRISAGVHRRTESAAPTRLEVAGPEVPSFHVLLRPPGEQGGVALRRRLNRPVQLRREVVEPSFHQPFARVSINLLVRVEALDRRGIPWPPNAERAHAELDAGLRPLDGAVEISHEDVDVAAAPVVP